jgi:hypothetical protein
VFISYAKRAIFINTVQVILVVRLSHIKAAKAESYPTKA